MAISAETRAAVRTAFGGQCGYCGVSETSVGGALEIDHFHPLSAGGSGEVANLVYACTACNRFKGEYHAAADAPEILRLLRPKRDELSAHIAETISGRLLGITARGWLHIQRVHLNRPQLIEMRRLHQVHQVQQDDLGRAREAEARLKQENSLLQGENARLRAAIMELLRRGE